ncbi:hypothetical protein MFRU_055g00120 [Monilinia fructicola]|nr:hypothetical protein MFRU_055g00120 [Monilinia fructicola]
MTSPSIFTPEYLGADKTPSIYAAAISTFCLASLAVPLRVISRRISSTNLWFDDWFIFVAYLFACGVFAATILLASKNPTHVTQILKSITPAEIFYTLSIVFAKYSILSFYWRVFGVTNRLRNILIALGVIVTAWGISVIVVSATSCLPLKALWNPEVHGKCVSLTKFYLGISFPNVITDWIMLVIPIRYIWRLQMPNNQKVVVLGLFVVGSFVCIVSLVRLIIISHLNLTDITWGLVDLDVWTCVESFSAVLCACLPSLKPIFNLMTGKPANQASRSTGKGVYTGSQSNKNTWKKNKPSITTDTLPESITRLRDDDAWAPVTTAEGTNSPEDIGLQEVGKKTNEINVTKEIAWGESRG